eukprot:CAMPEP_0197624466 /NCGR_PEP_ID=MMETSP1338-20131121/4088_1 /TAXON_ID=43686 ORGANISM="Pelagodinium beii, Strain RCC1491" /NCGR_SAMPLE_ID=MMETSP1338 /ASSEMBLY_ACC=CAM_ASM_000754 /LENGTH=411 /DNA_ID=CAMNT_0043194603 /DNA_START=62 /DNA_END=1297 /DNA_ORIENTATION=+
MSKPRPATALNRVPAQQRLFWSLDDAPQALRAQAAASEASYAHDPSTWLLNKHQDGEVCASSLGTDQRKWATRSASKRGKRPMMGRPQSAPQLTNWKNAIKKAAQQEYPQNAIVKAKDLPLPSGPLVAAPPHQPQKQPRRAQSAGAIGRVKAMKAMREAREAKLQQEGEEAKAETSASGRPSTAPSKTPKRDPKDPRVIVRELGYCPGLQRKGKAKSLFPKEFSDLPEVFENMQTLKEQQLAEIAAANAAARSKEVKVDMMKDICVLKFPDLDPNMRLLVRRWQHGFCEMHVRNRRQSRPSTAPSPSQQRSRPATAKPRAAVSEGKADVSKSLAASFDEVAKVEIPKPRTGVHFVLVEKDEAGSVPADETKMSPDEVSVGGCGLHSREMPGYPSHEISGGVSAGDFQVLAE